MSDMYMPPLARICVYLCNTENQAAIFTLLLIVVNANGCLVVCDLGRFLISSILLLAFGFSFQQHNTSIFDSIIENGASFEWVGFIKRGGP